MEFYTVSNEKRPVRLKESTRKFAEDSLHHVYGLDTKKCDSVVLDDITDFENMTPLEKYNRMISRIVSVSRVRICPGEMLSGAATLGMAIRHLVPAVFKGSPVFSGVSHLTVDFKTVLKRGINGIDFDITKRLADPALSGSQRAFLLSARHCIHEMRRWHQRYLEEVKDQAAYAAVYRNLLHVPFTPAGNFYEAVQSIWFTFAFIRLCGNWPGIGRIDDLLGGYLKKDLENGSITLEYAREILAHFFIKGCEWICGGDYGSGDAQHYQNIVLAGVDENGNEVTNEVTYLVLDILEELPISDFPTSVRLNSASDERLLRRVAEVMKHGGGVLALYNEEEIIDSLTCHGYSLNEARTFANDGCWEIQIPGKTYFCYVPFDALSLLLNDTLHLNKEPAHYDTFEQLKNDYYQNLEKQISTIFSDCIRDRAGWTPGEEWVWTAKEPCTIVSLFEDGCIETARSYLEGGARYTVVSPHIGGAPDVGNSLRVIDKLCFQDKIVSFDDFMQIIKKNWEKEETLRQYVLNKLSYYGNDDDEADSYTVDVADTFAQLVLKHKNETPLFFVPGISTFGRQIEWRFQRPASPHGHKSGDVLAPNLSATPGSDITGATALIRSYCKIDLKNQVTGAALDLKLLPLSVRGKDGTNALVGLMRGFVELGGCFLQPDVVDNEILREAQKHPENYQSLSVRVSGWNARFVTLNKEWQDMCIEKTTHGAL